MDVDYYECATCGYVQTEQPTWLERAYAEAINDSDTGIMARNLYNVRVVPITLLLIGDLRATVVDYAGGYGILVRLLRDYGLHAFWSDRYCKNLVCRGFEYSEGGAGLVTAFECFEHFVDPAQELQQMLKVAPNILFSTEIIPEPMPKPGNWYYYGREHGQHIGFYKVKTLDLMAKRHGKYLVTDGRYYHLFCERPINEALWKIAVRSNRVLSLIVKKYFKSLTWDDHLTMSAPRKDS